MTIAASFISTSSADDAALVGLRDIVGVLGDTDYRLIGGMAITVHLLAASGVLPAEVTQRSTADNDIAMKETLLAVADLDGRLTSLLYKRTSGNTWERALDDDEQAVAAIDVVIPSRTSRQTTRKVGTLTVDALPGIFTAISRPSTVVDLAACLRNGEQLSLTVLLPDPLAILTTKAFACMTRSKDTDWPDLWRCLELAAVTGVRPEDFTGSAETEEAVSFLRARLSSPNGVVKARLCPDLSAAASQARITRIRALTGRVISSGRRPEIPAR